MKLSHAGHGKGGLGATLGLQQHLPEPGGEVQRREYVAPRSSNLPDASFYVPHGVLVHMCLLVEGSEVLNQSNASILLQDSKYWAIVFAPGGLHDSQFEPFHHVSLDFGLMGVRNPELFYENWLVGLQGYFMQ